MFRLYLIIVLLFLSCNSNDTIIEKKWNDAQALYNENDFENCVADLMLIIKDNPVSLYAWNSKYLISEIYINEYEKFYESICLLDDIINACPDVDLKKKSLFTKGYIYANYLFFYKEHFIK